MMRMDYTNKANFLIPNIQMDEQKISTLGRFGRMRKAFLKENHSGLYQGLLMTGKLSAHLLEIDRTADERLEQLTESFMEAENVNEALKAAHLLAQEGIEVSVIRMTKLDASLELPGVNTVLIAEKRAQANVITRREEVASTRSLLNTAKLMDENKTLYKLKELEYVERICENVGNINIGSNSDVLAQLTTILHGNNA